MKKYTSIGWVVVLMVGAMTSCKKSDAPPVNKDYTASIEDKTWWGIFIRAGKNEEYYGVHFNSDHTFLWSQFSDNYTGAWAVDGHELTMTFDVSKVEIKAGIGDDEKLVNITDNTEDFEMYTGQLIANSTVNLEGTKWEGKPIIAGSFYAIQLNFKPLSKVDIQETYFLPPSLYKSYLYSNNDYERVGPGTVIKAEIRTGGTGASMRFFGIVLSDSTMKGSEKNADNLWQAAKQ